MIALDTNVLVRFLVDDPGAPEQNDAARELVTSAIDAGQLVFIPEIVLIETTWVLLRAFRVPESDVEDAVEGLLHTRGFVVENAGRAARALSDWRTGEGGFAAYLIRESARDAGAEPIFTFDGGLHGDEGLAAVE